MIQGDIVEIEITGLNNEGEGIARVGEQEFVLFVPNALPGEKLSARVVTLKKKYGIAKVLKRYNDSADRVNPKCPSFGLCGGCQLQHLSYEAQLKLKTQTVYDALTRIGGIEQPKVEKCLPSPNIWHYRNKASVPAQKDFKHSLKLGFYKKRSHDVVEFKSCPVLFKDMEREILNFKIFFELNRLNGYNEKQSNNVNNFIRHLVFRFTKFTKEASACLVVNREPYAKEKNILSRIKPVYPLNGIILNKNNKDSNFIWGDKDICILGVKTLSEKLGKYKFSFEISSFFQVNPEQAKNIYEYAAGKAKEYGAQSILELYAGIGTLSCFLAENARSVTAVESWKAASKYILKNARRNNLDNIKVYEDTAEKVATELSNERFDTIVLDPPRTGCDKTVIEAISKISPQTVIYVSCNPATLARDAKLLAENGYTLISAQPFDMFPQTGHVETVAVIEKMQ